MRGQPRGDQNPQHTIKILPGDLVASTDVADEHPEMPQVLTPPLTLQDTSPGSGLSRQNRTSLELNFSRPLTDMGIPLAALLPGDWTAVHATASEQPARTHLTQREDNTTEQLETRGNQRFYPR